MQLDDKFALKSLSFKNKFKEYNNPALNNISNKTYIK